MPFQCRFLERLLELLMHHRFFITVPLSALLIGVEELIEFHFSCPCLGELNEKLTISIFIGPALFLFALMCSILRPFRNGWFCCLTGTNADTQPNWPKALASCLIPSVMWVIILFLDGDYVACAMTDWKGVYVFDSELNRSWCRPTEGNRNQTELRDLSRKYVHQSQFSGYVVFAVSSLMLFASVSVFDCCVSGKLDRCSKKLLKCCGRTDRETQNENVNMSLINVSDPPPEMPTGSATVEQQLSGIADLTGGQNSNMDSILNWSTAATGQPESGYSATLTEGQEELQDSAPMISENLNPRPQRMQRNSPV